MTLKTMNETSATETKQSAAKSKILDAATDLFYKNGIHATGIDAVIEAADVARMTLYKYFPSKDALVEAVLLCTADRVKSSLLSVTSDESLSPRGRVLAILDWQISRMGTDGYRGCPFVNAIVEAADPASAGFQSAVTGKSVIREQIAAAVDEMGVPDPVNLIEQIVILLEGASVRGQMGYANIAGPAAKAAVTALIDAQLT